MKAKDVRQSFLDYFRERGHTIVESAPVIPQGDPTLLFTNSGMNQFKDVFLGTGQRPYKRAADTQKCIRAGGKHNDLDDVGKDGYHQTFFEMLGNWSFGDYFKAEAIEWSWDLLTRVWGIDKEKLYVTVHHSDDEARELWPKIAGLPRSRVLSFGDKDNFWEMGETGPCGPCTEIHIDRGPSVPDVRKEGGHASGVNSGSERFIELWNNVFIQYERRPDRSLEPLPAKHVDTGMGLERVCQVLQGVYSNYDTDLFTPLMQAIEQRTRTRYDRGPAGLPMRAIADHVRCLSFAIADGAVPDRTGRGYVLRRILRRASRFLHKLGVNEPALKDLVPVLSGYMGDAFPELRQRQEHIQRVLEKEEEQFLRTLDRGVGYFEEEKRKVLAGGGKLVSGAAMFHLYGTLGFPPDLTEQMAEEAGLKADRAEFERLLEDDKGKSRAAGTFKVDLGKFKHVPLTRFSGYERLSDRGRVAAAGEKELVLDETPFYAEGGGQVGDTGRIVAADGAFEFEVQDTKRQGQVIVHLGEWLQGEPAAVKQGAPALARVDEERRLRIMRNHSATHVLHWALHKVLGKEASQAGSEVSPNRLRFDFNWTRKVGPDELQEIERLVNERIARNDPVQTEELPLADAKSRGAIAMFGEKYGEVVRVVQMGTWSLEFCGGTHVLRTGDIGVFKLIQEGSVSEGVRRVAALTGDVAVVRSHEDSRLLAAIGQELRVRPEEVLERIARLQEEIKELARRNKEAMSKALPTWEQLKGQAQAVGDVKLVAAHVPGADADALRRFGDAVQAQAEPFVGVFVAADDKGKVPVVAALSAALVQRGWHSRDLVRAVAGVLGGGGGGNKAELCTGSGKDAEKIPAALAEAERAVRARLS